MTKLVLQPQVAYHRNGVAGEGFHLVQFKQREGRGRIAMVATVFETRGCLAVIRPDRLWECWRGDDYENELREAIAAHWTHQDDLRRREREAGIASP